MAKAVSVEFDRAELAEARAMLSGINNGLAEAIKGAVNDTKKSEVTKISSRIRETVNIKKRDIDRQLKAGMRASAKSATARIILKENERPSLKAFGAKQTKKGVTYKIDKRPYTRVIKSGKNKGQSRTTAGQRNLAAGAFLGPNGHAFRRYGEVKKKSIGWNGNVFILAGNAVRGKIAKLHGISPWGTYVQNNMDEKVIPEATELLQKNLVRRVRLLLMWKSGAVKAPKWFKG